MYDENDDSREELLELARKRKQRKRIFAFVLAVVMLVTFAIPISMMFPIQKPENSDEDDFKPPLYSADAET